MELFLSDGWFKLIAELEQAPTAGPLLNLIVTGGPQGERRAHLRGSAFGRDHAADADATITLPFKIAHVIFVEGNFRAAMPAFTAGQIQVEGSLDVLAQISHSSGDELRELRNRLLAITEPVSTGPKLPGEAAARGRILAHSGHEWSELTAHLGQWWRQRALL